MKRKYYEAYDDRYRQIHAENLQWAYDEPSPIVMETVREFGIDRNHKILELGCGEGRDAYALLKAGYNLLATDISAEVIAYDRKKWPEYAESFGVLDCIAGKLPEKFHFIYAVAVVHMLVEDGDRDSFYAFIREHLTPDGIALICTMGDGKFERKTDPEKAFDLQNRTHEQSGKTVQIASTTCRMVSFETLRKELSRNGLTIIKEGITAAMPDFSELMYAVVKKMALKDFEQPELITISDTLRLRKFDGNYALFLPGYQNPVVYQNSEGIFDESRIPNLAYVTGMCKYLAKVGELYYIEVKEGEKFIPIGDVTIKDENPPIAIWEDAYRGKGVGTLVMQTVIARLRTLGYTKITGSTVYKWNTSSQRMHEKLGFVKVEETEKEIIYALQMENNK